MTTSKIPFFEDIDFNDLDGYYDAEINVNGKNISVNINFEEPSIDEEITEKLKRFIEKLNETDKANLKIIQHDFVSSDTVKEYLEFHVTEMAEEEIKSIISNSTINGSTHEKLLDQIHLQTIWLYPHEEDYLSRFDYSLGKEYTNYVVVVSLKDNGELHHIGWES